MYLPTVASGPLSFLEGAICSSFFAEACAILQAFCWSRKHQQVCHFSFLFLLSDSRSVLASLLSPPSFLLPQSLWKIWQELSFLFTCSITLRWVSGHSFLSGNDASDELARRKTLLAPSAILCSLSPLISRIHSCLFSDWRHTVSLKFFDSQVFRFSSRNLCSLLTLDMLSLIYAKTDIAFCKAFISLGLAEPRILSAAPAHTCPRTPLISLCIVQLRTLCATRSLATLCNLWSRPWGVIQLLGHHGLSPLSISRKGQLTTTSHNLQVLH